MSPRINAGHSSAKQSRLGVLAGSLISRFSIHVQNELASRQHRRLIDMRKTTRLGRVVPHASAFLVTIEVFNHGVQIEHLFVFQERGEGTIHLLVDPLGDGFFITLFEGAPDAILTAKGVDAEQARDDGVAREGGHLGATALTD